MRLTKFNPETGRYEYITKPTEYVEYRALTLAAIQRLGELEDKIENGEYERYREILKLYKYCQKTGVECKLEKIFDGYAIRFNSGGDFIQHRGSYGCDCGCVEPSIGCRLDYTAVPLKNAIALVRRHKDKLNKALAERSENGKS